MIRPNPPLELCFALPVSLAAMLYAAWLGSRPGVAIAAFAYCAIAASAALKVSQSVQLSPPPQAGPRPRVQSRALGEISRITAMVYGWGGLALLSLYRFTPLHWQHGWQYGSAMLVIAAGLIAYVFYEYRGAQSEETAVRVTQLAAVQGLAALAALIWLAVSGKLATPKADWAANAIFMAGGLAIAWISFLAVRTHMALKQLSLQR